MNRNSYVTGYYEKKPYIEKWLLMDNKLWNQDTEAIDLVVVYNRFVDTTSIQNSQHIQNHLRDFFYARIQKDN